jgi:hypothetical protein
MEGGTKTIMQPGVAHWTQSSKRLAGESMFAKGDSFLEAAALLKRNGGHEFVVLHLLCQAIENFLKSVLLLSDYDNQHARMRSVHAGGYGHSLVRLAREASEECGLNDLKPDLERELAELDRYYLENRLRYGGLGDLITDPRAIPTVRVGRRLLAAKRLAERYL